MSDAERQVVEEWLLCEECTDELDRVLNEIGWRAIRRLAGALERPPLQRIDRIERQLRDSHKRSGSPLPQAAYVATYRDNYIAQYQRRAAIALGDLAARGGYGSGRARSELKKAVAEHEAGQRQYRDDVLAQIHRSLREATGTTVWVHVTTGTGFSCGLTTAGDVYCWGINDEGELGKGTQADTQSSPVPVSRHITFTSLSAGLGHHTCGVASSSYGYCWGGNAYGQLGDSTTDTKLEPVPVAGAHPVSSIGIGAYHTCADSLGSWVLCWGRNDYGQLGDNSLSDRLSPVYVLSPLTGLRSASAGVSHTCAMVPPASVACWGRNSDGQLGDGTTTDRLTPVLVVSEPGPLYPYASVNAGGFHTCAITTGGAVHCWGRNNNGQLGNGTTTMRTVPGPISSTETFAWVAAGLAHTCAVTTGGDAYCWGHNEGGQLGDGTQTDRLTPVQIAGYRFASLDAGDAHTCGVTTEGEAYCWGRGDSGQLGNGALASSLVPTRVAEPSSP